MPRHRASARASNAHSKCSHPGDDGASSNASLKCSSAGAVCFVASSAIARLISSSRIVRGELLGAMEIIECAGKIVFGHQLDRHSPSNRVRCAGSLITTSCQSVSSVFQTLFLWNVA